MIASATFLSARRIPRPTRFPRAVSSLPVARAATVTGSWRYQAPARSRLVYAGAFLAAAALHAVLLLGFNQNSHPARVIARAPVQVIQMELPPVPPDEPEETVEELHDSDSSAVAVPQLAERPSIERPDALVQHVDFQPAVDVDSSAMKQLTIPTHIARGTGKGGTSIFDISQLDRAPVATAQPPPRFPQQYKNTVNEARVTVNFVVDASGRVINANVVDSTHPGFHEAALDGVRRWKFRPGMKAGRKVATNMLVTIRFNVEES
ncbi:MAG TPA: energy transducer TonB [Candidatus Didemnitutus sp.]|nr:energy transducer TonB [Candidatus Didemnitutus sp.]